MNTYKFLNVPNHKEISEEVYTYIKKHTMLLESVKFWNWVDVHEILSHNPKLKAYIDSLDLKPTMCGVIVVGKGFPEILHIDGKTDCRILWPVLNCETSETRFYEVNEDDLATAYHNESDQYTYVKTPGPHKIIDTLHLTQPAIFNPGAIHSVHVKDQTKVPRISFSIGFEHTDNRASSIDAW